MADIVRLSEEAILDALELAKTRAAEAERERAELDRVIAAAREEQRLLQRLLDIRRGVIGPQEPNTNHAQVSESPITEVQVSLPSSKHPSVQAVIDELATAARPLHISELMRLLRDRGVMIPGAGTQANLIAHLRRDRRLLRTSRGMYGLTAWGLQRMEPATRVRRRRRRVRATAAK